MGFSLWLKENRLRRLHNKLKSLRARQARLREQADTLTKERKRGGNAEEVAAKLEKVERERDQVTAQIAQLVAREDALKGELKAAGATAH